MWRKSFILFIVCVLVVLVFITGCNNQASENNVQPNAPEGNQIENVTFEQPMIAIEMAGGGKMVLELYPEFAPETVQNFVNLAHAGFYDGLTFHRIVQGFMIQGGDPKGNGSGGSGQRITGEFAENGFTQNTLQHTRGTISMARSQSPNSASSQFFIMHDDVPGLDGKYAAFGRLVEGEEVLDAIAATPVDRNPNMNNEVSKPKEPVVIEKVTVYEKN